MESNIVKEKSYNFALRVIKLYKYLKDNKNEFVLSKQVLKSGTSIGANIEEAIGAISKNDFINKMYIAHKECRETKYWLKLLIDSSYITERQGKLILNECDELIKITGKIVSSAKKNRKN